MQKWRQRLESLGEVILFDYPYMLAGRKRPDPAAQLIAAQAAAVREIRATRQSPVVLIGKSMGGRMGCHVSLVEPVDALICLGYPLCAMGDRTKLRDQVLRELRTPVLFVQGTRDSLCPLDLLEPVRKTMSVPNDLYVVEGGDHSLLVRKRDLDARHTSQEGVDEAILQQIVRFLTNCGVLSPGR